MKYIRTEDGVYELKINEEDKKNNIVNYFYIDFSEHLRLTFDKKELRKYKQADTIKELCDEYVLLDKELNHRHIITSAQGFMPSKDYELYGAIWITGEHNEPILKSVAKVKGILPNGEIDWELL